MWLRCRERVARSMVSRTRFSDPYTNAARCGSTLSVRLGVWCSNGRPSLSLRTSRGPDLHPIFESDLNPISIRSSNPISIRSARALERALPAQVRRLACNIVAFCHDRSMQARGDYRTPHDAKRHGERRLPRAGQRQVAEAETAPPERPHTAERVDGVVPDAEARVL
jgi:hypothetical protein